MDLNKYIEMLPDDVKLILIELAEELARARVKHPKWPEDHLYWAAIVAEESGELIKASLQNKYEGKGLECMRLEAIQVGAMAVRFILNYDGDE
jgi:hypothetical protein